MANSSEAHGLGPHVVGQRIVVRRIVHGETGPSGGPAMTDLLGICTSWGEVECTVAPEIGEPVRIALADIVSGKPVPPRPPTRHRVSPLEAQTRALALWPALDTEPLGSWVLRRSATSTARRANSVLAFGDPGLEAEAAYERVVDFYARPPGSRPIAAVLPDSPEDALFRSHDWVPESHDADTLFQLAGVAQLHRRLRPAHAGPAAEQPVSIEETDGLAVARWELDGELVASGVASYSKDWVGFRSIEVTDGHRRRGHALTVMSALLDWGAEQGATTAYLQVLGDNSPALGLYRRLGFSTHHAYRYLAAPPDRG